MSAAAAGLSATTQTHSHDRDLEASLTTDSAKHTMASQKPIASDMFKQPWQPKPTNLHTKPRFSGPQQDDSTYTVICGLRTIPARFLIWFNLPLCWFVGIVIASRQIETWLKAHFSGSQSAAAIAFVAVYVVYTFLAHTVAVFAAMTYELWRNPYARAPSLRGEIGREEEVAMLLQNRVIARRMGRTFLPCMDWRS